jgi:hypothetical protein
MSYPKNQRSAEYQLDYNDQCDIVYGRIARLNLPLGVLAAVCAEDLPKLGLVTEGLGVSGNQVEEALSVTKEERGV